MKTEKYKAPKPLEKTPAHNGHESILLNNMNFKIIKILISTDWCLLSVFIFL